MTVIVFNQNISLSLLVPLIEFTLLKPLLFLRFHTACSRSQSLSHLSHDEHLYALILMCYKRFIFHTLLFPLKARSSRRQRDTIPPDYLTSLK
ncbi:hypothetical protein CesoFtcFv8_001003 [Champsocephalus esox]|uniref:Uncharacterized protein n=1 Tax=Champsocephalus esox TaxID=159716 RepID=A0AAN8HH17_9TELE|nr:hypothetical protein CesoFtcFv8_001003 [Champsocephalus esox]